MTEIFQRKPIFADQFQGVSKLRQNPTFADEVSASWQLTSFGQFMLDDQSSYIDMPYDPPTNIEEQLVGYEPYSDYFMDVRNQQHLDYVKEKIDYNNYLREVRDDGSFMAEIVAELGNPAVYVPIPFATGISFASRFAKGALGVGGVVALEEPVRHAYDPTATLGESIAYVGGAAFLGGTILGAFGRRGTSVKGFNDNVDPGEKVDNVFKAFHDSENDVFTSKMFDENDALTYDIQRTDLVEGNNYKMQYAGETEGMGLDAVKIIRAGDEFNGKVIDKDTVFVDINYLTRKFKEGTYVEPEIAGAQKLPFEFATADDYMKFLIQKEHIKFRGGQPLADDVIRAEDLLNQEVYDDIMASKVGRQTAGAGEDRSWFAENVDRWLTDMGRLMNNNLKNKQMSNQTADFALAMSGDSSLVYRASKAGFSVPQSALVKATANHFQTIGGFNTRLQQSFQKYRKGIEEVGKEIKGYNLGATGIRVKDRVTDLKQKLGFIENVNDRPMTFIQFNEAVTKSIRSDNFYDTAPKEVQQLADDIRKIYAVIGDEAEKLGMFTSQKSVERLKIKYGERLERINRMVAAHRTKYPKDKAGLDRLKLRQKQIENRAANYKNLERDLIDNLVEEFNPLVKNYVNRVYDIDSILDDITKENFLAPDVIPEIAIKNGMLPGMVVRQGNKYGKIKTINDNGSIQAQIDGKLITIKKKDIQVMGGKIIDNVDARFFSIPEANTFRGILYNSFARESRSYKFKDTDGNIISIADDVGAANTYLRNARVDATIKNITRDAQNLDMEGDLNQIMTKNISLNALNSRNITATDEELLPFLINDVNYLVRLYSERMHKRIEMTKKFGEPTAEIKLLDNELDLLEFEYKGNGDLKEINLITETLRDNKDKYYNIFNTGDPGSFMGARLPSALRNWASTAMMGKVALSSIVDMARIPMVHGLANTMKYLNSKHIFAADRKEFNDQLSSNAWLGDAYDVVMNNASNRLIGNTEYRVGRGTNAFSQFFDRNVAQPLESVQSPFYHLNLLSVWTQTMKEWTQHISTHRFLEDSAKVANGTATKEDIARLASYGISKQDARAIGKLPTHKTTNGMLYTKQDEWLTTKNGLALGDKIRYASFQDVQRTIITPSMSDKPNMMFGVIRVRNEGLAKAFDNDVFRFLSGFEKTEFGGKFNNGFLALPFQFFAWSFAANRKLMLSGLSGREMSIMSGVIGMLGFAVMGDYLKNPQYYQHKTTEEKIYRAIEMSGLTGLIGDVNFSLEVVSEGMFDTPLGVRPMLGTPGRFGEANVSDATGEFIGAGPGMLADLIYALGSDTGFDEKAQTIRRLIPFNNLIWFDGMFKKIYNQGVEVIR